MCPNCPRIPLADCQCGFAGKERGAIRQKLARGWSEERVRRWYLEQRGPELGRPAFGQEALTTPPDSAFNRLSWLLPYSLSALAMLVLLFVGTRWARARGGAGAPSALPDGQRPCEGGSGDPGPESPRSGGAGDAVYEELLERELKKMD